MNYNIVFATDENYVQHLCVAIVSLLKNNRDKHFTIYIINGGISAQILKRVEALTSRFKCELISIPIEDEVFSGLVATNHFTKANYYRLLIPSFIFVDRILYLDADIVVNGSIEDLYNVDIGDCLVGAVENPGFDRHAELGMNKASKYFNSGVMVINLMKWRQEDIAGRVIRFVSDHPAEVMFVDQCGLNSIIDGNWHSMLLKYNQQAVIFESDFPVKYNCFSTKDISTAKEEPIIIHFSGSSKPWHLLNNHPYKSLYWKYLRMTHYRFSLPADLTLLNMGRRMLPGFLKNKLKTMPKFK